MNYKEKLNNLHESVFGRIRGYDLQYQEDILKDWEELKQAYKGNKNEAIKELKQVWPQLTQNDLNLIKKESAKVDNLLKDIKRKGLLDDRREYDVDDLKSAYPELSKQEAEELYNKIRKESFSRLDDLHESVFGEAKDYNGKTMMRGDTVKIHPKVTKDPLNRQGKKGVVNRILGNDVIEVLFPDRKKGKYDSAAVILLSGAGSESVSTAIGVTNSRDAVKLLRKLDYDVQDIGAGKINVYGSHSDYEDAVEELRNANLLRESTSKKEATINLQGVYNAGGY